MSLCVHTRDDMQLTVPAQLPCLREHSEHLQLHDCWVDARCALGADHSNGPDNTGAACLQQGGTGVLIAFLECLQAVFLLLATFVSDSF